MERLDLHPNDGVDEEEHGNEQDDVRQSLNEKTNTVVLGSLLNLVFISSCPRFNHR